MHEDEQKWDKVESLSLAVPFLCDCTKRPNVRVEASDHIPVITVTSTKTCTAPRSRLPPHISTRLLSSIVHRENAENLYEEVIPELTADMEIAESPEELERIYVEFQKVMLLPWRSAY